MKSRIFILLVLSLMPMIMFAQWQIQDPGFTVPKEIKHIHAVDASVVWITAHAGNGQQILSQVFSKTTDGGTTWTPGIITDEELSTSMIFALNDQIAFVPMYRSGVWTGQPGLFKTIDGGETWSRQSDVYTDPTSFPDIVHFFDNNNGMTLGDPVGGYFEIYITSDGGTTWTRVSGEHIPNPLTNEYATVDNYAYYANSIWVPTTKGRVLRSTDLGATWAVSVSPYPGAMYTAFYNENQGVVMDHQSWYYTSLNETGDGGVTWSPVASTGPVLNWDITYVPGTVSTLVSTGVVAPNGLSFSVNGGYDWHYAPQSEGINFFHSAWISNTTGWAGGFNEETQQAVIYKYDGPGLTGLILSTDNLVFDDVTPGETAIATVVIYNDSENDINILEMYTNVPEFIVPESTGIITAGSSLVLDVFFNPYSVGSYSGTLYIITDFPDLENVQVSLTGNCIPEPSIIGVEPGMIQKTLYAGQSGTETLTMTNNGEVDVNYQASVDCGLSLGVLDWNYGSTPLGCDDGILCSEADQAMFIKEFTLDEFSSAMLNIGYDDGGRFWVNGTLVLNDVFGDHGLAYWNYEIDISSYLSPGINRISAVVFNGVFAGCCEGAFDCELLVDGVEVIKSGFLNPGVPEAMWYYYGQSGQQLVPVDDVNGLHWWETGYGKYDWVTLSQSSGQTLEELGWNYQSTPFTGADVLSSAPDNAQFIKDFTIGEFEWAMLLLGFDDGCRVWINGVEAFDFSYEDHSLEYWNHVEDVTSFLQQGLNRISVEVYNGIYAGGGGGGFDCELLVDNVPVILRGNDNYGAPEAMWYVYGVGGQVLTPPLDSFGNDWYEIGYGDPESSTSNNLTDLNWNFGSTPFNNNPELLYISPDNAQFIKDFNIDEFSWATLFVGFDDGCKVWLNGQLVFDYSFEVHEVGYWDHEDDITGYLQPGRNRIAVEVYNGIYGGGGFGGFDCMLIVDDIQIIKEGIANQGQPEAMWYYYGQAGQILTPPADNNGLSWYDIDYGINIPAFTTTITGTLPVGQSQTLDVRIDAKGFPQGSYQSVIHINFDEAKGSTDVPVIMDVISAGSLVVSPDVLSYGDIYLGYPESLKLNIKNIGDETVDIYSIWSNSGELSIDNGSFTLEPGQASSVTVTIMSFDAGPFLTNLYIDNSTLLNPMITVRVAGTKVAAPSLVFENLEYMYAYLAPDQSELQNLHVSNWGGSPLVFSIPQAEQKNMKNTALRTVITPAAMFENNSLNNPTNHPGEPAYYQNDIIRYQSPGIKAGTDETKASTFDQVNIFYDDMENGMSGWTIQNYGEGASQWHQVSENSYSPETSWWCGNELTGTYYNNYAVREALITPSIKLPDLECSIFLEFNESYQIEGDFDQCFVDISLDGGNEWIRIRDYNPGISGGWITTTLEMSSFYGNEIQIRFFFDTGDDVANFFPGWYIDDVRIYFGVWGFLHISPAGGTINANEGADVDVTFDATGYSEGFYLSMILFRTNDPEHEWFYLPAYMDVWNQGLTQQIFLQTGWSGISSYLVPENTGLEELFNPIVNDLIILKNPNGMYWPQEEINTLGDWNYLNGYAIKMNGDATLDLAGTFPENRTIDMQEGWTMIPVLSNVLFPANNFDVLGSLIMIKEVAGSLVYWPQFGINTLQELEPGRSYLVNVSQNESLEFPPMNKTGFTKYDQADVILSPWNEVVHTAQTHSIAIPSACLREIESGDVIGVFTCEGICAGFSGISDISGSVALTAYGDDPTTPGIDGLQDGETIVFKLFRSSTHETVSLAVTYAGEMPNDGFFTANGISAINDLKLSPESCNSHDAYGISVYPNPTDGMVKIISDTRVQKVEISDMDGTVLVTINNGLSWDSEVDLRAFAPGIYQVKIISNEQVMVSKIVKR